MLQVEESSPYLNRFTQPDSIVSNPYNPQAWNRYAYVLNNPLKYIDPSGHRPMCDEPSECYHETKSKSLLIFRNDPGQNWTQKEKDILNANAQAVAGALARAMNKENWMLWKSGDIESYSSIGATDAFYKTFGGPIVARRSAYDCDGCWAEHRGKVDGTHYEIWVYSSTSANDVINHPLLFTHEIGHAFDAARGIDANSVIPSDLLRPVNSDGIVGTDANGEYYGYFGPHYQWQFGRDPNNHAGEEFADMFVGWVYNRWEGSAMGTQRQEFMNALMVSYLP